MLVLQGAMLQVTSLDSNGVLQTRHWQAGEAAGEGATSLCVNPCVCWYYMSTCTAYLQVHAGPRFPRTPRCSGPSWHQSLLACDLLCFAKPLQSL